VRAALSPEAPSMTGSDAYGTEDRTVAILSYLTFIGFIVAVILYSSRKTQLGAFHLRQALGLFITAVVFYPVSFVLAFIPILGWLAMFIGWVALLVLAIMGFVGAVTGKTNPVPIVGPMYQRWFANAFT
jgi:uncharacterized membrane protein